MSHLCIIHSPDGAPWADYTTSKLLDKFPELKIASIPDERAFSNCVRDDPSIPESEVVILIASPSLVEYLRVHSDVVFNGTKERCVKHCLILLLGLEKEEMDEKADHFPAYEKWTHLTLTDDQEDLVAVFQRIIEIMQEIVNSRTQQQVARRPKPQVRPKPEPKKQPCVDVISGDELDITKKVAGEGHYGRPGKSPAQSEIVPGGRSEGQSGRTLGPQDSGDSNVSVDITPATPQEEENKTIGSFDDDDTEYARNLTFVKGTAVLKTEQCQTISDNDDDTTTVVSSLNVQKFASISVKRETDTDDSIYQNRQVKTSDLNGKTGDSTAVPDLNGNLVTESVMSATDSPAEDFDDIDGPSTSPWDQIVPHPHKGGAPTYRPRSGRVSGNDMKRFRNRSAASRFNLSPSEIDGDVSFSTIYLLPSATVVAERLCFHRCLSVHRGRGSVLDRHPSGRQTAPWADNPPGRQTPPRQTPSPPANGTHRTGMHSR